MFVVVSVAELEVMSRPSFSAVVLATDKMDFLCVEVKAAVYADVVGLSRSPVDIALLVLIVVGVRKEVSNDFDVSVTSLLCNDFGDEPFTMTSVVSGVIRDVTLVSCLSLDVDIASLVRQMVVRSMTATAAEYWRCCVVIVDVINIVC